MNNKDKLQIIKEYIKGSVEIGERCNDIIDNCINLVHSQYPSDNAVVFSKLNNFISASEDLAYVILCIRRYKTEKEQELRSIKDPKFTILVRGDRPSTQAIESEIRTTIPKVAGIEQELMNINNILDYLSHIEKCLDRSIWSLRDIASYIKK